MLQLNTHQQSVLFKNLTSLPFCSTFIGTVTNTISNAMMLALHSVNVQRNSERYNCSFSAANTNSFIPIVCARAKILVYLWRNTFFKFICCVLRWRNIYSCYAIRLGNSGISSRICDCIMSRDFGRNHLVFTEGVSGFGCSSWYAWWNSRLYVNLNILFSFYYYLHLCFRDMYDCEFETTCKVVWVFIRDYFIFSYYEVNCLHSLNLD